MTRTVLALLLAALPARASLVLRPVLPADIPTLHLILAPAALPAAQAAAGLAPSLPPRVASPRVILPAALPAAAGTAAAAAPLAEAARLPVRASLEAAGAALAAAPAAGSEAALALDGLFTAARAGAASAEPVLVAVRRAADAALLDAAMSEARRSATGRRVLARAEAALGGKPLPLQVRDLGGNLGEYDYMAGVLRLDRALLSSDPRQAAATLVHELTHVLQHRAGVPAEALEMELEAHLVSLAVGRELGIPPTGFEAAALRELAKGPRAYVEWMAGQLPGKTRLAFSDMASAREGLEAEVDELESAARLSAERLAWARRDLALLRGAKGRAAYASFTKRVMALVAARSRALRRGL